jgi:hypothetical protein
MPAARTTTEQRALDLVRQLRKEGETIRRVELEGRKIVIELADRNEPLRIDEVNWK